jgi:hypothetical protein
MRVILKMVLSKVRENIYIKMEIFIMVYGSGTGNMGRAFFTIFMKSQCLNATGTMVKNKV